MAPAMKKVKEIELSEELKSIFEKGYSELFDRYNEHVKESLDDLATTKELLIELYEETKKVYDNLGAKNIMLKVETGKILTDLIKSRNSITKDRFQILDKSTTSMTNNLKTLESVAKTDNGESSTFNPVNQFKNLNKHMSKNQA